MSSREGGMRFEISAHVAGAALTVFIDPNVPSVPASAPGDATLVIPGFEFGAALTGAAAEWAAAPGAAAILTASAPPNWATTDAAAYGRALCTAAHDAGFAGANFLSLPDFGAAAFRWLSQATKACRAAAPAIQVTSSPDAALFVGDTWWADAERSRAPDAQHDRYFIRYSGQSNWANHTTYDGIFHSGLASIDKLKARYPNTPPERFVIAKTLDQHPDEDSIEASGWMQPEDLKSLVCQAISDDSYGGELALQSVTASSDADQIGLLNADCPGAETSTEQSSSESTTEQETSTSSTEPTKQPDDVAAQVIACQSLITGVKPRWYNYCQSLCTAYSTGGGKVCADAGQGVYRLATCVARREGRCAFADND